MISRSRIAAAIVLTGLAICSFATTATAQDAWPTRPVRILVGFAAGGATDIIARLVAQKMEQTLHHAVVVENRPGAGGNISAQAVAQAEPDGYTLGMVSTSIMSVNRHIYKQMNFDPRSSFTPIGVVATIPNILTVNPGIPVATIDELGHYLREKKGDANCASPGAGTTQHIGLVMLMRALGADCLIVHYRGNAPAGLDVMSGRMALHIDSIMTGLEQHRSGAVRAIAVTGSKRLAVAPEIPAIAETISGFDAATWAGLVGPKGLPETVVAKIRDSIAQSLLDEKILARLRELGTEPAGLYGSAFAAMLEVEDKKWGPIVTSLGLPTN